MSCLFLLVWIVVLCIHFRLAGSVVWVLFVFFFHGIMASVFMLSSPFSVWVFCLLFLCIGFCLGFVLSSNFVDYILIETCLGFSCNTYIAIVLLGRALPLFCYIAGCLRMDRLRILFGGIWFLIPDDLHNLST